MHPDAAAERPAIHHRLGLAWNPALGMGAVILALAAITALHAANWDEFHYLRLVHDHVNGRLDVPLQTLHVHLFAWLADLPGHEMTQLLAGRTVMAACLCLTAACVFRIGRTVAGPDAALLATFAFATSGFVLPHGASFRADPLAAALLMTSLATLLTTELRPRHMLLAAVSAALAFLVTIKAALFLPAFLGALVLRSGRRDLVMRILATGLLAMAFAAALYLWHRSGIAEARAPASATARAAFGKTLGTSQLLPRRETILVWLILSLPLLILAWRALRAEGPASRRAGLALLVLPVASLLVYRNAFPYFFPFIVPPMAAAAALGAVSLGNGLRTGLVALMLLSGLVQTGLTLRERTPLQAETLGEVHRLFPEPVPTISGSGLVSSFPNAGFFMSSWGIEDYRHRGVPVFAGILERTAPPLLLTDRPVLYAAMVGDDAISECCGLLPDDAALLRRSYVHYWGPIWLAGGDVVLAGGTGTIPLAIAGRYRVEADAPVTLNGDRVRPGDVVALERGPQSLAGANGDRVRLVWATAAHQPPPPPTTGTLFYGFWALD